MSRRTRFCDNCGEILTPENDARNMFLDLCSDCHREAEAFVVRPRDVTVTSVLATDR
jgi:DNA-directed RNA polymerase subunit M/transcription elongation factor TFIIS